MTAPLRNEIEAELSPLQQTEAALAVAKKALKRFEESAMVQSDAALLDEVGALRKRLKKASRRAKAVLEHCTHASAGV